MVKWENSIVVYLEKTASKFLWICPVFEVEDFVQEGWLVFQDLKKRHGKKELEAHHGVALDEPALRGAWMAYFMVSVHNRFCNMVRSEKNHKVMRAKLRQGKTTREDLEVGSIHAVELACDLERAPGIRMILENASWDQAVARIRKPRRLADGTMETRADVLQRVAGRRRVGDFDAQLSMVV